MSDNNESSSWTREDEEILELALAELPENTPQSWERIAAPLPGRSVIEVQHHLYTTITQESERPVIQSPFHGLLQSQPSSSSSSSSYSTWTEYDEMELQSFIQSLDQKSRETWDTIEACLSQKSQKEIENQNSGFAAIEAGLMNFPPQIQEQQQPNSGIQEQPQPNSGIQASEISMIQNPLLIMGSQPSCYGTKTKEEVMFQSAPASPPGEIEREIRDCIEGHRSERIVLDVSIQFEARRIDLPPKKVSNRRRRPWTDEEQKQLDEGIHIYGWRKWTEIAKNKVPTRTSKQVKVRAYWKKCVRERTERKRRLLDENTPTAEAEPTEQQQRPSGSSGT